MRRQYRVIILAIIVIIAVLATLILYHNRASTPLWSVNEFGPLKLGDAMPSAGPGYMTFAPYRTIPASRFYVLAVQDDHWCSQEDCGLDGALIQTMGGWLQGETPRNYPDLPELIGFDREENRKVKSLVVVDDGQGTIVGMYPNRDIDGIISILKLHPGLADFSLLPGVGEFGPLKVGEPSPLKPGDLIGQMSEELRKMQTMRIPEGKAFYLYSLESRKRRMVGMYELYENTYACIAEAGCRYPDPDPPHDFLFAQIDELSGWFLASDEGNAAMIELFGLDRQEVLNGKSSLVVLTDAQGIIVDLHPGKTLRDALTILYQHPKLVDVMELYQKQ